MTNQTNPDGGPVSQYPVKVAQPNDQIVTTPEELVAVELERLDEEVPDGDTPA